MQKAMGEQACGQPSREHTIYCHYVHLLLGSLFPITVLLSKLANEQQKPFYMQMMKSQYLNRQTDLDRDRYCPFVNLLLKSPQKPNLGQDKIQVENSSQVFPRSGKATVLPAAHCAPAARVQDWELSWDSSPETLVWNSCFSSGILTVVPNANPLNADCEFRIIVNSVMCVCGPIKIRKEMFSLWVASSTCDYSYTLSFYPMLCVVHFQSIPPSAVSQWSYSLRQSATKVILLKLKTVSPLPERR